MCSMTGSGAVTARMSKPEQTRPEQETRRSTDSDDLRQVERVVKRQPLDLQPSERSGASSSRGEMREIERVVRRMTRDQNVDIPVEDADGRLFIVRKIYR